MESPVETTFTISQSLLDQAGALVQRLNLTRSQFFAIAVESFIRQYRQPAVEGERTPLPADPQHRDFHQGDVYWVQFEEAGVSHPHVIIQDDVLNRSRIHTVIVCALTTNLKRAKAPGNVLLEVGEGNLPRQSVVEASKVSAVYKRQLGEYIGTLSAERVDQVLAGLRFLQALGDR